MAKVTVKGLKKLDKVAQSLRKELGNFLSTSGKVQDKLLGDLKKEIKSGKSPATGKNFRKLKSSTIESRRRRAEYNTTDPSFSPEKSALTFTGQLVNSIKAKVKVGAKSMRITIEPTGRRKPYKNKDGSNTKGSARIGNKKLAQYHAEGSGNLPKRDLLGFTKKKEKEILELFKGIIREILSKKIKR